MYSMYIHIARVYTQLGLPHSAIQAYLDNPTTYEDLGALMDHLDLRSAHLMGLSLGGRIAVDFLEHGNGSVRVGQGVAPITHLKIQLAQFCGQPLEFPPVHIRQRRLFLLQAFAALLQLRQHLRGQLQRQLDVAGTDPRDRPQSRPARG